MNTTLDAILENFLRDTGNQTAWQEGLSELAALRSDLATARQAMLDYIGSDNRPDCGCPICKWLAAHPQKGETE